MRLSQNLVQAHWGPSQPLLQLPHISQDQLRHFNTRKVGREIERKEGEEKREGRGGDEERERRREGRRREKGREGRSVLKCI